MATDKTDGKYKTLLIIRDDAGNIVLVRDLTKRK